MRRKYSRKYGDESPIDGTERRLMEFEARRIAGADELAYNLVMSGYTEAAIMRIRNKEFAEAKGKPVRLIEV